MHHVEKMIEESRGDHETRIDGTADDATKRVPGAVVEPVVEIVEALSGEVLSGAVVEVGIEFVNDRLVAQHREEASRKGCVVFLLIFLWENEKRKG